MHRRRVYLSCVDDVIVIRGTAFIKQEDLFHTFCLYLCAAKLNHALGKRIHQLFPIALLWPASRVSFAISLAVTVR